MFFASSIDLISCPGRETGVCESSVGARQQVRIDKSLTLDNLSYFDRYGPAEHGPIKSKSVKLSSLTTRVDLLRKSEQELFVERATGKASRQMSRIDASYNGSQATGNHFLCQLIRGR